MEDTSNNIGCLILFVILAFIIFCGIKIVQNIWTSDDNSSSSISSDKSKEPDEIELMTYAQEVLKDNLISPKYSSYKGDYTFIGTGLRYKIEGKVNNDKFWMIIQFTDNTYTYYDLISLQVGQEMIYKK